MAENLPRILLIDDDESFGTVMKKLADRLSIRLTYLKSVNELASIQDQGLKFDVGIFDYDLGSVTGIQLSRLVELYVGQMPVLLVSAYGYLDPKKWPEAVKGFIPKNKGFHAILHEACQLSEANRKISSPAVS